jgi:hypothetical protein
MVEIVEGVNNVRTKHYLKQRLWRSAQAVDQLMKN